MSDPNPTPVLSGLWARGRESVLVGPAIVWAVLMGFLVLTNLAAHLPLGRFKTAACLGLAAVQVALVVGLFMRLDRASNLVRLAAAAGVLWAGFLFILVGADYLARS